MNKQYTEITLDVIPNSDVENSTQIKVFGQKPKTSFTEEQIDKILESIKFELINISFSQ